MFALSDANFCTKRLHYNITTDNGADVDNDPSCFWKKFVIKVPPLFIYATFFMQLPSSLQAQEMAGVQGPPAPVRTSTEPVFVDDEAQADVLSSDSSPLAMGEEATELATAIELAARTFPTVAAARASERAARASLGGAKWARFPGVSLELLGGTSGSSSNDYRLSVEQPLWTGGRISGMIKMSRAQVMASQFAVSEVQLDVAMRVSAAYFEFQRLIQREAILDESLGEYQKLVDSMERRVANEISPAADLELARSRAAQVAQEKSITFGQRRMALTRLRELTGDPTFSITSILSYDPAIHHPDQEGLLEQALAFDPKRRKLNADILVATADVQVRKSAIFPQLNAQYEKPTFGPDRVGIVLRAQTDGGLSRFSAVSVARERQASAEIALLSNERELREQIEVDELENAVAKDRAASSSVSATSATAVTESFMRQFVAGRRTWFDVMNAVRESMTARISEVDARISAMASASRLLMRSGRWTPQAQKDQGQ
jgi:adhesin transport system outer membrane protein